MKTFLSLLIFVFSSAAFSNAHVGEMLKHKYVVGGVEKGTQTSYVSSYDFETFDYTVTMTSVADDGSRTSAKEIYSEDEIWSHAAAKMVITNCSFFQGVIIDLTLSSGTYQTCKMPMTSKSARDFLATKGFKRNSGFAWIGDFPINGIAKFEGPSGTIELLQFRWN